MLQWRALLASAPPRVALRAACQGLEPLLGSLKGLRFGQLVVFLRYLEPVPAARPGYVASSLHGPTFASVPKDPFS